MTYQTDFWIENWDNLYPQSLIIRSENTCVKIIISAWPRMQRSRGWSFTDHVFIIRWSRDWEALITWLCRQWSRADPVLISWLSMHWSFAGSRGGIPLWTKVMRKEARHTQMRDRASGVHPDVLEHIPPQKKPESAYCIALCSHLWFHWGLSPTTISLSLSKSLLTAPIHKVPCHSSL